MENYAQGVAASRPDATYTVTEVDPVDAALSLDWPLLHREYYGIPLHERHYHWARLHAGALFGHDKFSATEIFAGRGQQDR